MHLVCIQHDRLSDISSQRSVMGLVRSLGMLLLSMWLFSSSIVVSLQLNSTVKMKAKELDARLQDYAYQAFPEKSPETGKVFDGSVPHNLSGIQVSALRLVYGSLSKRGQTYKEFEFPVKTRGKPFIKRLVLVYQNLGNRSMEYYPLQNYTYLAPVLGFRAYDGTDLKATNLAKYDISATDIAKPILIKFPETRELPNGVVKQCVFISVDGTVQYIDMSYSNICLTSEQGHFSIVANSTNLPPAAPSPPPGGQGGKNNSKKVWKIVGLVIGGLALLVILGLLVIWLCKSKRRKMHRMEKAAEAGESLHMTTIGSTKAPAATGTRTQPSLETEYVP